MAINSQDVALNTPPGNIRTGTGTGTGNGGGNCHGRELASAKGWRPT